jgi:DNA primase
MMNLTSKRKERIEHVKKLSDIHLILNDLDIEFKNNNDDLWFKCIIPGHKEKKPSCHIDAESGSETYGRWYCFGCQGSGDVIDLVGLTLNISFWESINWIEARLLDEKCLTVTQKRRNVAVTLPTRFEFYTDPKKWNPIYLDYLEEREITWKQIVRHKIGYCDSGTYQRRIIIPIKLNGSLRTWVGRTIFGGKRYTTCTGGTAGLFGSDYANPKYGPAIVTEGWTDALRVERLGYLNVMAIQTNTIHDKQFSFLKKFKEIILIPDGDPGGDNLINSISQYISDANFSIGKLPRRKDPDTASRKEIISAISNRIKWYPTKTRREIEFVY